MIRGRWHGKFGLVPAPGHSDADRSAKVWDHNGEILVYSYAGEDWRAIKREWRQHGLLPGWSGSAERDTEDEADAGADDAARMLQ